MPRSSSSLNISIYILNRFPIIKNKVISEICHKTDYVLQTVKRTFKLQYSYMLKISFCMKNLEIFKNDDLDDKGRKKISSIFFKLHFKR